MILNSCKQKLKLEYPCSWVYKIIGLDQEEIRIAITEVLQERECMVSHSNTSSKGKYHCFNVEITVHSEEDRAMNHEAFKKHPAITMVL